VVEEEVSEQPEAAAPATRVRTSTRIAVILAVAAVFAGVVLAKYWAPEQGGVVGSQSSAASLTSVRNDASADYAAALESGKPIYVLFHSLS